LAMRAPVRLVRGGWPRWLEKRLDRFCWDDTRVLARIDATPDQFRKAMSAIYVGDTIKITGSNRHPIADDLLISHLNLAGKTIVDLGASDGSTSVDLVNRLPDFGSYVIADLFLTVSVLESGPRLFVYGADDQCILVAGPHLLAWPTLSRAVRTLYRPLLERAERQRGQRRDLLLLNPAARELIARDPRVSYRVHDVFTVWSGEPPDIIKIANLLRRLYFSDADIVRALQAVHASLCAEGHLLIVDNPRIAGISARAGLYRRTPDGFDIVAESEHVPEISDLILGLVIAEPAVR
jgi:hypothetical protein